MADRRDPPWDGAMSYAIGKALMKGGGEDGLTAAEIADMAGKHQSNVKKAAEKLVATRALRAVPPPEHPNGGPGRRPETAFAFAEGERERFEDLVEEDAAGNLGIGAHVVFVEEAEDGGNIERLDKALELTTVTSAIEESIEMKGDGKVTLFPFRGPDAHEESEDLIALFRGLEVKTSKRTVAKTSGGRQLRDRSRRRRNLVERALRELKEAEAKSDSDSSRRLGPSFRVDR